jgi:TPR repeat protein
MFFWALLTQAGYAQISETARAQLQKAAEKGEAWAQYELGRLYENGNSVPKDYGKAFEWFQKAAEQEHHNAKNQLAKIIALITEQGDARAQYNLGERYARGDGVPKNEWKADELYQKAAEKGHVEAKNKLALKAQAGNVQVDKQSPAEIQKAAEQGDAEAQYNLGLMYNEGKGVPQNYFEAAKWYQKAADQGLVKAKNKIKYNLVSLFIKATEQGDAKAIEWLQKMAEQGNVEAQNNLLAIYAKAAEQGEADAQYNLGLMYDKGYGVTKDYQKGSEWIKKAADQGHTEAQKYLFQGGGATQDSQQAFELYQKAAKYGIAEAQNYLFSLNKRERVTKESQQAFELYQKAAELGNAEARYELGRIYDYYGRNPNEYGFQPKEHSQKKLNGGKKPLNKGMLRRNSIWA